MHWAFLEPIGEEPPFYPTDAAGVNLIMEVNDKS
jgi:hypothetical protein